MYHLRKITPDLLQVLWGRLSCEIFLENWEEAHRALVAVKTAIEIFVAANKITTLRALEQRTWLLHWSLFVFWNDSSKGLENMVELFKTEPTSRPSPPTPPPPALPHLHRAPQ